jgi:ubiquinone/menaquinone biosynthesis C-methylase UbiE
MHASHAAPVTAGRTIRWARYYDTLVSLLTLGQARSIRKLTADLATLRPGEAVLDVGCGTGELTRMARSRVGTTGRVCGIDAAPEMIAVAQRKAARAGVAVDFQVAAIEQLPFPDASFDVVLSSLMMHHLPDNLKRQGLAEIARVLKPGGRLLVLDLRHPITHREHLALAVLAHGKLHSGVQDLPAMLGEAGFIAVEVGTTRFTPLGFARARTRE